MSNLEHGANQHCDFRTQCQPTLCLEPLLHLVMFLPALESDFAWAFQLFFAGHEGLEISLTYPPTPPPPLTSSPPSIYKFNPKPQNKGVNKC